MARAELKRVLFAILCDCGMKFVTEDFEGECPWCGRIYCIELTGSVERVDVRIRLTGRAPSESCSRR